MSIVTPLLFDLQQTLDCGQAFRWHEIKAASSEKTWEGIAFKKYLRLTQTENSIVFHCSQEDFDDIWFSYFDLGTDYYRKKAELSELSPVLKEAIEFAPGIRILKQEPWEAICSFIISQNNNIKRIKGIIGRFCALLGEEIEGGYSFPDFHTIARLEPDELAPIRAGFRSKYIISAAREIDSGNVDLSKILNSGIEFGREELQKIRGIGPKVAECALLYGFHKTKCFPLDVWMKRAMQILFPENTPEDFGENAGLAQQYIFHYSRMHPELFKEEG